MLRISMGLEAAIRSHGKAAYPEECCGVMIGHVHGEARHVQDVVSIDNARADQRERRFLITPRDYMAAEKTAAARDMALIGFYHSHPDHPARPSQYDLDHALPWHSYVVVAVEGGQPADMTSWVMTEDRSRFDEEDLIVTL